MTNKEGKYVVESHVVTYAPSATVLYLLRQYRRSRERPVERTFLGVGDVIYAQPSRVASTVSVGAKVSANSTADFFDVEAVRFPDLPGSGEELRSVAGIIGSNAQLLLGANATESAFKALTLRDFGIIHFAVHGVANIQYPDRAALVLSKSAASADDGLLQVREIKDLGLNADLVILSACDSGNGRLLGTEGIASLERAFVLAGAKSVIASPWTADDTYTIALTKRFYQHLVNGIDKGDALRRAKLDLIQEFGGPQCIGRVLLSLERVRQRFPIERPGRTDLWSTCRPATCYMVSALHPRSPPASFFRLKSSATAVTMLCMQSSHLSRWRFSSSSSATP